MPSRRRKASLSARRVLVLALLAVAVIMPAGSATADPSVDNVEEKVEKLNVKVEQVVEKYNRARIELDDARRQVRKIRASISEERQGLSRLRSEQGAIAAAAYRSGGFGGVMAVLTAEDPQSFIDRASLLNTLVRDRNARVRRYESEMTRLKHREQAAIQALETVKRLEAQLDRHKDKIQDKLDEKEALLEEMTAPVPSSAGIVGGSYTGSATGSAGAALDFAYAQLGKPYSWGAAGPNAYDCSGLTMAAWAASGVSLPHSSQLQFNSGPHVARSDLQPGDLVFFGSPIHHVGLYAGGGRMVHAPNPGETVQVTSITSGYWASTYVGAVRP